MENYKPISCDFYDELEAFSTLKKEVEIFYEDDCGLARPIIGKIQNLYSREKVEYLLLDNGKEIRLDLLVQVDNKVLADFL